MHFSRIPNPTPLFHDSWPSNRCLNLARALSPAIWAHNHQTNRYHVHATSNVVLALTNSDVATLSTAISTHILWLLSFVKEEINAFLHNQTLSLMPSNPIKTQLATSRFFELSVISSL